MTRRFFTNFLVGLTMALPIRVEARKQVEPTTFSTDFGGPLSPLRKMQEPLDIDKFMIGLEFELGRR